MITTSTRERVGLSVFTQQLLIVVLSLFILVMAVYLLREFATMLKPLFIAAFLGYLVIPAHQWLVKKGINRPLAAVSLIMLVVGILSGLGYLLYSNTESMVEKWPVYERRFSHMFMSIKDMLPKSFRDDIGEPAIDAKFASAEMKSVLGTFFNFLSATAIVIIYLAFLLAERASLPRRLEAAFGSERAAELLHIFASISRAITEYISVKAFISLLGGIGTALILAAFGVDFALTWGTLAFLLNFIPYLGSLIATVLPVMLAVVQLESIWLASLIGVLLIAMQQFLGVVVEPRMAGAKLGVSPLLIILSLAFWGVVWGIVGMLLSVPLLMILKIVFENVPATKPVAILMGK